VFCSMKPYDACVVIRCELARPAALPPLCWMARKKGNAGCSLSIARWGLRRGLTISTGTRVAVTALWQLHRWASARRLLRGWYAGVRNTTTFHYGEESS